MDITKSTMTLIPIGMVPVGGMVTGVKIPDKFKEDNNKVIKWHVARHLGVATAIIPKQLLQVNGKMTRPIVFIKSDTMVSEIPATPLIKQEDENETD